MTKPELFLASTDYATAQDDASGTLQVTVPGSTVVTGGFWQTSTTISLGRQGATLRSQINASLGAEWWGACEVWFKRTGVQSGVPTNYTVSAAVSKSSATDVVLLVTIMVNNTIPPLTTQVASETFTANVQTFLSPFQNN